MAEGNSQPPDGATRRGFITGAVSAVAGAGIGAAATAAALNAGAPMPVPEGTATPRPGGPGFDHLVVVMFENRSFDNLLGYLYEGPDGVAVPEGQSFEGLQAGHSNTAPDGQVVAAHPYEGTTDQIMRSPDPDPGEEYPFVNTQLFGGFDPAG